jgi:predicted membrane protein
MKLSKWLKKLEKKRIISKKPNPILPFVLAFLFVIAKYLSPNNFLEKTSEIGFIFTLAFAILHLVVVINLKK